MDNTKILTLIRSKTISKASDKVKYCSWTIYVATIIFQISMALVFLVLTIFHDRQNHDVFGWFLIDGRRIMIGHCINAVGIYQFLQLIENEPSKAPKQFKTLLKELVHFGIKLYIAMGLLYTIFTSFTIQYISLVSALSTMSNTLVFLKLCQAFIHLILTKVSTLDILTIFFTILSTILCSPLIVIEGFYSLFVTIWSNQSLNDSVPKGEKMKRTVKIFELMVSISFFVSEVCYSPVGVSTQQTSQLIWYILLYMMISVVLISMVEKILTDIEKATCDLNLKRNQSTEFSFTIFCIEQVLTLIIRLKSFILKISFCLIVIKRMLLAMGYILFARVVQRDDLPVVIGLLIVCEFATLIGLYYAYLDYKENTKKCVLINEAELTASAIELKVDNVVK